MKLKLISIILAVCVVFAVSCNKNNSTNNSSGGSFGSSSDNSSQSNSNTFSDAEEPRASRSVPQPGHVMLVNTGFFVIKGEDTGDEKTVVEWKAALSLGDKVETGETRNMISNGDKKSYDFIAVRRETGERGFASAGYIAIGGQLAVVKDEECFLYKTPRTLDVTITVLSHKTVVVYYPETEKSGFVEVKAWDSVRKAFVYPSSPFVRTAALSMKDDDIQAAILLHTALVQPADQKLRRDTLLKAALQDYPDNIFYNEINNALGSGSSTSSGDAW